MPQSKVFIETIKQIQSIIATDALLPGDKLPSERELSERLSVGRSSVREALRGLELLGLIETRRGEGTYVKDFGDHHLVEIIGSFILQNEKAKSDLLETKKIIEEQGIILGCVNITDEQIKGLRLIMEHNLDHFLKNFLKEVFIASKNGLLLKIWLLLWDYSVSSLLTRSPANVSGAYEGLITSLEQRNVEETLRQYRLL